MDFTREPIIETIITPKEGYKLVIRSSKSAGQEEYFVDAIEIVAFGHALFFRSLERPKAFLVPVSDYEILEVREARMVLKNAGLDRSIKIGGGREGTLKASREVEKGESVATEEALEQEEVQPAVEVPIAEAKSDVRVDKKRDRRRHYRKRKGREEGVKEEAAEPAVPPLEDEKIFIPPPEAGTEAVVSEGVSTPSSNLLSSLLQPPPMLISETINRYRQNELFKAAFYLTEEEQYKPHDKVQELLNEEDEEEMPFLQEPDFKPEQPVEENIETAPSESESQGEPEEEPQAGQEESQQQEEEPASFFFREETSEERMILPLYAEEEDISMPVRESFETSEQEEEEKPAQDPHHPSPEER